MSTKCELLDLADKYLDQSQFALARDKYREAIGSPGEVTAKAFSNLSIAEEAEPSEFLRSVLAQRPDWGEARLALAHKCIREHRSKQAVVECVHILARDLLPNDVMRVRIVRYKAAVSACAFDVACDDFAFIWMLRTTGARRLRRTLMKGLASIDDPRAIDLLVRIGDALPNEGALRAFLDAKAVELRALSVVRDESDM